MSIFNRMSDVVRSNINALIDRAEDPEKMANQIIIDLDKIQKDVTAQVAASIAEEKRLMRLVEQNHTEIGKWESRAMDALEKDNEELAREAIRQKQNFENNYNMYLEQHQRQEQQVNMLKENLQNLNAKIEEARLRRDQIVARSKNAQAQSTITKTMNRVSSANSLNALDRMEQKVQKQEAINEAYVEMNQEQNLEKKFSQLETEKRVEDDLAALKAKLGQKDKN